MPTTMTDPTSDARRAHMRQLVDETTETEDDEKAEMTQKIL